VIGSHRKINQRWSEYETTPLHLAAGNGSLDVIQLLLSCGADVASEDLLGETPLHYTIRYSTFEAYRLLADFRGSRKVYRREVKRYTKNNDVAKRGSLLHLAAQSGWESLCEELIQHHNYNVEWEDVSGNRAIHLALSRGHMNLARQFVTEWRASLTPHIQLLRAIVDPLGDPFRHFDEGLTTYTDHWGCDINAVDAEGHTIFCDVIPCIPVTENTIHGLPINLNQLNNRHQPLLDCETTTLIKDVLVLKLLSLKLQVDLEKSQSNINMLKEGIERIRRSEKLAHSCVDYLICILGDLRLRKAQK
jgi:hypothetical protein